MGADLYITKLDRKSQYLGFEVSKNAVNKGYFRDPYNNFGLFNFLNSNVHVVGVGAFSWWHFADRKDWFNRKGNMTIEGAEEFYNLVSQAQQKIEKKRVFYLNIYDHKLGKDVKRELTKEEVKGFKEHLQLLVDYLQLAIKLKSTIIWSV
jgi:hypothetical protein